MKGDRHAIEKQMKREEIEQLRKQVGCATVLENAGFAIDLRESTRRAVKFRRASEIIIVTHEGRGWFDPLGDAKGDVFSLVARLDQVGFFDGLDRVAALVGFEPCVPVWRKSPNGPLVKTSLAEHWLRRCQPWPGSASWRYLCDERSLPAYVVRAAIAENSLREGPCGSMWAAHRDASGQIVGWEARGPEWRGFATGGSKVLFHLGARDAGRLCVAEAAIDAMSLAAIEGIREDTLYLSTGGGWSPSSDAALRALAGRPGVHLVAATDANAQGDSFAARLRTLAEDVGCEWQRLRPPADDWNEVLRKRELEKREIKKERRGVPHSRRPRQGKASPGRAALDPAGRDAGGAKGVMKD